jgi:tripartite-type tricarboxylate transporter receptor subunit TctC
MAPAPVLADTWGRPVVVDNRPGAGGNLATARRLNPRLPYDPERDLLPLALLAGAPLPLVAPADAPAGSAWPAAARAAGGQFSHARWAWGRWGTWAWSCRSPLSGRPARRTCPTTAIRPW